MAARAMRLASSIYGLGIQANVAIAGLAGLDAPAQIDVRLTMGSMPPELDAEDPGEWRTTYSGAEHGGDPTVRVGRLADSGYVRLSYDDGTEFVIDAPASHVWATWLPESTLEDTATYLLGPVLGFVLRLRGVTCLHAAAVAIEGRAVALVGAAGCGKSSTAAAFAKRGHAVLTDDVAALSEPGDRFHIQPAYPRVRLWPESVAAMFGAEDALPRLTPTWEKRFLDLREGRRFQREALPLAAVYFLEPRSANGEAVRIEPVAGPQGVVALLAHSHATQLLDKGMRRREFDALTRLAASVPLRRVTPSADFLRIDELCEAIAADV